MSAGAPLRSALWDFSAATCVVKKVPLIGLSSQNHVSVREFLIKTKKQKPHVKILA